MQKKKDQEQDKEKAKQKELRVKSDLYKRPYGLCGQAGISTYGLSPREAWNEWNAYRKNQRAREKKLAKAQKKEIQSKQAAPKLVSALPNMKSQRLPASSSVSLEIPKLSEGKIQQANANSFFNRGKVSEKEYTAYAQEILSWQISDSRKEKLLAELHKRWENLLTEQACHVPWTVSGPAKYNTKRLDRSEKIMSAGKEISDWFRKAESDAKNYREKTSEDWQAAAKREEENFHSFLERGWLNRNGRLDPTAVANNLAGIAQYDPSRYTELYEKYDQELHFKKNTNATKLYESIKAGTYRGKANEEKLHEGENLKAYKGKIGSGEERVFMKFATRPKPQLIYALKSRGWHWNSNENAWSVPVGKYDEQFVRGIEERYAKYL